jgi:hypothetical protein
MKKLFVLSFVAVVATVLAPYSNAQAQSRNNPKLRVACSSESDGSFLINLRPQQVQGMGQIFVYSTDAQTSVSGLQVHVHADVRKRGVNYLVDLIGVTVSDSKDSAAGLARASVGNIITRKARSISLNVASSQLPIDPEGLDCSLTIN